MVVALTLAGSMPWALSARADTGAFIDVDERYFPLRHAGITIIADRFGSASDDVVEHFEPHQLQHLTYCGTSPVCTSAVRDAGAVYYASIAVGGETVLAFYDENGNLVGISRPESATNGNGDVPPAGDDGAGGNPAGEIPADGDLVGSLAGEFSVNGSASYNIPIEVPPAFGGLEPQLSLTYDSNGGNGALGIGWQIAGIDNVTRCDRNLAQDARTRAVQMNGNDRFCLKGKRLVAVDGDYGEAGTLYRTRIASFVQVTSLGQAGSGPESFQVTTKAGETLYFGESADSRVADGTGTVLTWSLSRVVDAAGNVMRVHYDNSDHGHRPTSIEYSEIHPGAGDFVHRMVFEWESRPDVSGGHVAGLERKVSRRLTAIRTESNGERARRYGFNFRESAATGRSLLTAVQLCGSTDDDCLPATTIEWQDPDRSLSGLYRNRTRIDDNWNSKGKTPIFLDYDGDGDTDILLLPAGGVYGKEACCRGAGYTLTLNATKLLTNHGGTFSSRNVKNWFKTNAVGEGVNRPPKPIIRPFDYDGDGRQEIAVFGIPYLGPEYVCGRGGDTCRDGGSRAKVIDWKNGRFRKHTITGNASPEGQLIPLDMNGDGRQALLSLPERYCPSDGQCSGPGHTDDWQHAPNRLYRYTGSEWRSHGLGNEESILEVNTNLFATLAVTPEIIPIDTDGDGVTELLVRRQGEATYLLTPGSDGKSFSHSNVSNKWGMWKGAWYPARRKLVTLDFNGDGNQDLLLHRTGGDNPSTYLLLSNGDGFESKIDITYKWGMNGTAWNGKRRVATPNDFNGDGYDDILMQGINGKSSLLLLSEGDRFRRHDVSSRWGMNQSGWGAEKRTAYIMNYDGDSVPDLVLHATGDRSSWLVRDDYSPSSTIADRVTAITEGELQQYKVDYELAGLSDAYTPAPESDWSFPKRSLQGGFVIATRSSRRDGIGSWRSTDHEYRDLRVHQRGHGVLGFGRSIQVDRSANRETVTDMHNTDSRLVGLVARTRVEIDDTLIREVVNEYEFAGNQPSGVHFPFLQRSVKSKHALDGVHLATVTTENSGYDAWGNVGQVMVATVDQVHGRTWRQVTDNTWDQSTPETGRLLASRVTHEHPDGGTMIRRSAFGYDQDTGILVSETVQPGNGAGLELTTTYQLDRWGNKATTTVSGGAPASAGLPDHLAAWPDRVTRQATEIDLEEGLRKVTVTNALGHEEQRHHRLFDGALVRQVGPNDLPTEFEYDALGRKVRTLAPDGTEATVNRQWANQPDMPRAVYSVTEAATGQPSVTTWYDRLGRYIGKTHPGLDGRTVRELREYNARGEIVRSSRPHHVGDTQHWIEFAFDARGRVVERSFPLGEAAGGGRGTITTGYSGYETRVTDAEGRTTVKERNARDQLIRAIDGMGETVTYAYNAVGDLVETTDPLGRSTTFVYDVRGRKVQMTAPDMGTWSYVYNAFGELIAQTDARGQTVYIDYDRLGRKTRRNEPEGETRWCHDGDPACGAVEGGYGAAVGKLVAVTGPKADYRETVQYDSLGRAKRKTTWHLGEETAAYPIETSYDGKGRVDSMVYPGGFTLYNDYNQQGYLVRKVSPRDGSSVELDSAVLEAERLARMIARYEAKAADFRSHASLYERMANDYAAAGDPDLAGELDDAADELRDLAAELQQSAADAQSELDQLEPQIDIDAETLRVRYGPDGEYPEGQDPDSAAARAAAETWLDAAEEHLARAEQANTDGLLELRDQELALAENALAMARSEADEAAVPDPGDEPTLAEMVPQGSPASECTSTELYEVFWCAESADAEGRINTLHYGNGLVTHRDYEAESGQLAGIRTEAAGDTGIVRQDLEYTYDRVNNVTRRDNLVTGITQDYAYDANDRLTQANVSLDPFGDGTETSTYHWSYDAMGNRTSDTRVGTYGYADPSNPGRLTDAGGDAMSYDANGNVTAYAGKVLTWSSFNKPTRIEADGTAVSFAYAADRSRYRRHEVLPDGTQKTTRYVGKAFERTLTRDPGGSTTTKDRYFIHAAGRLVAIHTENRTTDQARNRFLHRDSLGTVTLVTDALGNVVERYAFRPFGERVVLENPGNAYTGVALQGVTPGLTRGFTGHEHIDGVGLIHMNGRVYDPRLGRFLSADPHVQFPDDARGYNRYVYVQNNPLKYSDPSGYFIKEVVTAAVSVFIYAVSVATMGPAGAAFASGFATSIGLGADLKAALKNGVLAAGTAFAFHKLGQYAANRSAPGHPASGGGDAAWASGGWKKVAAHATIGGASSEITGGSFRDGAIGAGFSQFASPRAGVSKIKGDHAAIKQVTMAAVIGGTGSALSGGRFVNGAATAAFGWLFNENHGQIEKQSSSDVQEDDRLDSKRGWGWFRPDGHSYKAGRPGTIVPPGKGVGRIVDDYLPAGHTFSANHDAFVGHLTKDMGLPDVVVNIPSMGPIYMYSVMQETVNTQVLFINKAIGINVPIPYTHKD